MYHGGESACDVFGAISAVTNTLISLPGRLTQFTSSVFNLTTNDVVVTETEVKRPVNHKPFSSVPRHEEAPVSSSAFKPATKKTLKQVKLAVDSENLDDGSSTAPSSLATPPSNGDKGSVTFLMPGSPSLKGDLHREGFAASGDAWISSPASVAGQTDQAKIILDKYYQALNSKDIPAAVALLDSDVIVTYPNGSKNYTGAATAADKYRALFNTLPEFQATISHVDANLEADALAMRINCHIKCSKTGLDKATDMIFVVKAGKIVLVEHKA
jgi:ketosteroid isomerase-like protein